MCIVVNTEIFIERSKAIYGDFFEYKNTVYEHMRRELVVTCPVHGDITVIAKQHLKGFGCLLCARGRQGVRRRASKAATLEDRATEVHKGKYLYHLVEYINSDTKVTIVCPKHGNFLVVPTEHLRGSGCPQCAFEAISEAKRIPLEEVAVRLSERIGEIRYEYDLSNYVNMMSKISIKCPIHGWFKQITSNHLGGSGCPKCAKCGFNPSKPGWLYILKHENIWKIGITNRRVKSRLQEINKSSGYEFSVVNSFLFQNGTVPDAIETVLLSEYRKTHKQPKEVFSGSTECFYNIDYDQLMLRVARVGCNVFNQIKE